MAKPKLTDHQRQQVVDCIKHKTATPTELAIWLKCHPRTIYRVMEDEGLYTPAHKKTDGTRAMDILKKHGITVDQLDSMLNRLNTKRTNTAALFAPPAAVMGAPH